MGLPQLPAAEGIRRRTKPDLETQVEKVTVPTTLASVTAALSEYTKQTRIDLINDPLAVVIDKTGDSLDSTLDILQDGVPRELGAANSTLTNVLRSIIRECRALSTSIGEPFLARALFFAIGVLLRAAKSKKGHEILLYLFENIERSISRLSTHTEIPHTSASTEMLVKIAVEILSVLTLATKQLNQPRLKKFIKRSIGGKDIEVALRRLDSLTMDIASWMMTAQTLEVVHDVDKRTKAIMDSGRESTDNTKMTLVRTASGIDTIKRDQLQHELRHWLSAPDPWINHNIARKTHQPGTTVWFMQGRSFDEWKYTASLLWIHGLPGSGKTILCSTLIEDVQFICQAGSTALTFFYFDHQDVTKQNARSLLSSLLIQLCEQFDRFSDLLSVLFMLHGRGSRQPNEHALIQCLKEMISLGLPVYIIMDGLDECPDSSGLTSPRAEVLQVIQELVNYSNVHICVTSRLEVDILRVLAPLTVNSISLHDQPGQLRDVNDYISSVIHSNLAMRIWPEEEKQFVVNTLTLGHDGMFRWASCQLETLRHCPLQNIPRALKEFPRTLGETYERILQSINDEKWRYAHRIFQLLMVAARPLRVVELAEVFVIEVETDTTGIPKFNPHWRHIDAEGAVLSACSSLIAVVDRHGERIVQFSHFSVQQFLTSDLAASSKHVSKFHLLLEPAHTFLARACLSILLQLDDRSDEHGSQDSPLASYAAEHWVDHAQVGNVSSIIKDGIERLFDRDRPYFAAWIRMYDIDRSGKSPQTPSTDPKQPDAVPLYYAALCGFYDLAVHLLITRPYDVNARGGSRVTPLHAALNKGHVKVAELLLKHDADVNARDDQYRTPLHLAAEYGDPQAVQSLIDRGADPNVEDHDQGTPLSLASRNGRLETVRLLLDHGADTDHRDSTGRTALHEASAGRHDLVAQALLMHGANADPRDEARRTPLHLASENGTLVVVKLLLEVGANVDARDESDWTPLHLASQEGHVEVVRLFLDCGADPNTQDDQGSTPLHRASRKGELAVAQVLLEGGAEVDAGNKMDWTPLHFSSQQGHLKVVRLLLDHGADVLACNHEGHTFLEVAWAGGHEEIADVNARYDEDQTVLHIASQHGDPKFMGSLIDRGADPNAENEDEETPLFPTSRNGKLQATKLLLERGADVNHRDRRKRTPLHGASENGHDEVTKLLIENQAKVNAQNVYNWTPLHLASRTGRHPVAQVLLENGAKVDVRNDFKWTPLHLASQKGHLEVVELLIDRGADVNSQEAEGETALHLAAYYGHPRVTEVLIRRGADPHIKNKSGKMPVDLATKEGHHDISQSLRLAQLQRSVELLSTAARDRGRATAL